MRLPKGAAHHPGNKFPHDTGKWLGSSPKLKPGTRQRLSQKVAFAHFCTGPLRARHPAMPAG
jgi:hypothetical protein